jgi:hypothetical protein
MPYLGLPYRQLYKAHNKTVIMCTVAAQPSRYLIKCCSKMCKLLRPTSS